MLKSNPEAERLLNEYQSSLKSPNWPAYTGTLGLATIIGGIAFSQGKKNIRYISMGVGVGLVAGSYLWGQKRRRSNEETLANAIDAYNNGTKDERKKILTEAKIKPAGPDMAWPVYTAAGGALLALAGVSYDDNISSNRKVQRNFRVPMVAVGSAAMLGGLTWGILNDLKSTNPNPDWPIYTGVLSALTAVGGAIAANDIAPTSVARRNIRIGFITAGTSGVIASLIWGISNLKNKPQADKPQKTTQISWGMGVDPFTSSGQIQAEVPL